MTKSYSVGGYRYTSLSDAIAQSRRMAKLQEPSMSDDRQHRPDWMGYFLPLIPLALIVWWIIDRPGPLFN
jgi:hypothetical protein